MSHREQISLVKVLEFIRFVSFEAIRQRGDDICSMLNIIGNIIMKYFHFMFQIQWMFGRFILQFKTFHISKGNIIMQLSACCKLQSFTGLDIRGKCIVLELSKNKFKNIKNVSYVLNSTKTYIVTNPSFQFVSKFKFNTNPFSLKSTIQILESS